MIIDRDISFTVVCNIRIPLNGGSEKVGTGVFINKDNKAYLLTGMSRKVCK